MRLIHYSKEPITEVYSSGENFVSYNFKPRGLWVSVEGEDDWPSWCKSEGFGLERFICATEVILSKNASIKYLRNEKDIDSFSKKYGIKSEITPLILAIDWEKLRPKYQGIIIAPYVWQRRLSNARWYYSWDCASGVIWDKEAVKEIKAIEPPNMNIEGEEENQHSIIQSALSSIGWE